MGAEIAEDSPLTVVSITLSRGFKIYPETLSKGEKLKSDICTRTFKFFF